MDEYNFTWKHPFSLNKLLELKQISTSIYKVTIVEKCLLDEVKTCVDYKGCELVTCVYVDAL